MSDIFISYAREDREFARALAERFEAHGWSVWWDRRILPGQDFNQHIQEQLDAARCIVVAWSKLAVASQYVRDEANEGLSSGRLVPVLVEDVKPPLGFRQRQAANLAGWPSRDATDELATLIDAVGAMVSLRRTAGLGAVQTAGTDAAPPPVGKGHVATSPEVERLSAPSDAQASDRDDGIDVAAVSQRRRDQAIPELAPAPWYRATAAWRWLGRYWRSATVTATLALAVVAYQSRSSEPGSPGVETTDGAAAEPGARRVRLNQAAWNLPDDPLWGFVEIPAGEFTMGSDKSIDPVAADDELPQHKVALFAYFIGKYEVTVGQYKACVSDRECVPSNRTALDGADDLPVRYVSWAEALAYCVWLEKKLADSPATPRPIADALAGRRDGTRWHLSLPSEAEWERAARGREGLRRYRWGDTIDATRANYAATGMGDVISVGSFPPGRTPEGVYDMAGNVWEWMRSSDKPYPYTVGDGRERLEGSDPRVVRGGSFGSGDRLARAAYRGGDYPVNRHDYLGFRVVMSRSRS